MHPCEEKCRRFTDTEAETMLMTMFLLAKRARFTVAPCEPTSSAGGTRRPCGGDTSEFEFGLRHAQAFDDKLRFNIVTKSYRIDPIDDA